MYTYLHFCFPHDVFFGRIGAWHLMAPDLAHGTESNETVSIPGSALDPVRKVGAPAILALQQACQCAERGELLT